jgi:hypothetical protein
MTLTAADYIGAIPAEVGDPDGAIATSLGTAAAPGFLWRKHEGQPTLFLQYLYVKRDALLNLMGAHRLQVTVSIPGAPAVSLSDRVRHLNTMLAAVVAEIERAELIAGSSGVPVGGDLVRTAPITPPTPYRDANNPAYAGWPYGARRGW